MNEMDKFLSQDMGKVWKYEQYSNSCAIYVTV